MGLTDYSLYYSLIALSIAAFVGTIYLWPHLGKRKVAHVLGRIGVLLVTNILIVVTLGISLNNYGGFYTSWSDVFGINNSTTTKVEPTALVSNQLKRITAADLKGGKVSPNGSVTIDREVAGSTSGEHGHVWIVLPKSAVKEIKQSRKPISLTSYRVIQALPGFPGTPLGWLNRLNIVSNLESEWNTRKLPASIAILTDTNLLHGYDGECFNTPGGPQIESWLSTDIHQFAAQFLGVKQTGWAIMGTSTGGWCAPMLALRHPQMFIAGASIAGYFTPEPNKSLSTGLSNQLKKEYDLRAIIKKTHPKVAIFATIAPSDHGSYFQTIHFIADMKNLISIRTVNLKGQGHNFAAWLPAIKPALQWAGTEFARNKQ